MCESPPRMGNTPNEERTQFICLRKSGRYGRIEPFKLWKCINWIVIRPPLPQEQALSIIKEFSVHLNYWLGCAPANSRGMCARASLLMLSPWCRYGIIMTRKSQLMMIILTVRSTWGCSMALGMSVPVLWSYLSVLFVVHIRSTNSEITESGTDDLSYCFFFRLI